MDMTRRQSIARDGHNTLIKHRVNTRPKSATATPPSTTSASGENTRLIAWTAVLDLFFLILLWIQTCLQNFNQM